MFAVTRIVGLQEQVDINELRVDGIVNVRVWEHPFNVAEVVVSAEHVCDWLPTMP